MKNINKNDGLINKLLKKGKYIAIPLSVIMMTSGLSACSNNKNVDTKQETSVSEEYKSTTVEIDGREYVFDDEGATYVVENDNDNMWEVSKDLNIYYKDIEEANDIDPHKLHIGDKIKIPKELFNYGSKMGLFASESLGKIDWEKVSCVCDFAYINYYDFRNDYEDSRFLENVKGCEENGIPYGIVVYGGIKPEELDDAEKIGRKDAKTISKTLEEINASLPTLFTLAKDGINYDNPSSIFDETNSHIYHIAETNGLVDFICSEEDGVKAEKYCSSFLDNMKSVYSNFTMLYTSDDTYDALYDIYENNYKNIYLSSKTMLELLFSTEEKNNPVVSNQIIFNMWSKVSSDKQCLEARSKLDLLGVDDSKEVCVFYDDSPSDKIFTISSDFKKANDDRLLDEMRITLIMSSLSLASITFLGGCIVMLNKLKKMSEEELQELSNKLEKDISKIKRKRKKK